MPAGGNPGNTLIYIRSIRFDKTTIDIDAIIICYILAVHQTHKNCTLKYYQVYLHRILYPEYVYFYNKSNELFVVSLLPLFAEFKSALRFLLLAALALDARFFFLFL